MLTFAPHTIAMSFKSSKMDESIVTHQLLALRCQVLCCRLNQLWHDITLIWCLLLASNSNFPSLLLTSILPPSSLSYILSTLQIIGCYAILCPLNMPFPSFNCIISLRHFFRYCFSNDPEAQPPASEIGNFGMASWNEMHAAPAAYTYSVCLSPWEDRQRLRNPTDALSEMIILSLRSE